MQIFQSNKVEEVVDYIHKLHTYSNNKIAMYDDLFELTPTIYTLLKKMTMRDVIDISINYNATLDADSRVTFKCVYFEGDKERKTTTRTYLHKDETGMNQEDKIAYFDLSLKKVKRFRRNNDI